MFNPFEIKRVAWKVTGKGFKRTFKVLTADGKEYRTIRKDRLYAEYQYGGSYSIIIKTIEDTDLLECGIKSGINVYHLDGEGLLYVQPIAVEQIKAEEIEISRELEAFYFIHKPKVPKEFIPKYLKCEILE